MKIEPPYKIFGEKLSQLRLKAGLTQQSDLATLVKTTQQTVSRWEKGTSRPSAKQLQAMADVLNASINELLVLAGHSPTHEPVVSYVQPFPIWALTPEIFEAFISYFLDARYPGAKVHQIGSRGHTQEGTDVEVTFSDGSNHSFQCKRHSVFGPDKVAKAVRAHTWIATKKFIALTRPASPQARLEIKKYADWDIWDVEDISREIRTLSKEAQRRLVDTFFRGQRLALLGEPEPGPWQTSGEFFSAFMSERGAFSHAWSLVGRSEEVQAVSESLSNQVVQIAFLVGPGGAGKSRILKQAIETYERAHTDVLVRFVSPNEEVTNKSLDELGDREKVIVVDDAHDDRNDLQLLFQYVAVPAHKAKLLLSFRPYGLSYIKAQASNFSLTGERISEVKLVPLNLEQAEQLATQVLQKFDGPVHAAKDIARLTLDCPLATVIGAQIVAREKIHLELAKNEDAFRSALLGKFQDIIAGEIGNKSDAESIKKLLKILALLQPFHPEDESIPRMVEQVEGLSGPETSRLIRLLMEAGVLFKRGGKYRLSPDLLADYVIEQACIGPNGKSTGYAEQVFDVATNAYVEHLLVNLGKLDWRRANGDPSNSKLLDGVWGKLQPSSEYSDTHISAVTAVAYYQPKKTLDFAENLIREQKYLRDLPTLIKYAAYNLEYLPRACECLWELGKGDDRVLHQTPGHAVRLLSEMCAVEPNRPFEYNEVVVDFGLSLLDQEDSWRHQYSPFDVLKGILKTEGHGTTSDSRTITFKPFFVSSSFVLKLRSNVIDAAIQLLSHSNKKRAVLAAKFLQEGLRYPVGMFNTQVSSETHDEWTREFVQTLEKIEQATQTNTLDPLVLIELVRSVSWHANYAEGKTTKIAKRLVTLLPDSLEFRTTLALIDGHGMLLERMDYEQHEREWNQHLETLTQDLVSSYPDGEQLRSFIDQQLANIAQNYAEGNSSYILYSRLINTSSALANATVAYALQETDSQTTRFSGMALSKLFSENHANGLILAGTFLKTGSPDFHVAIGRAYSDLDLKIEGYAEEDLVLLRAVLASTDQWVVKNAIGAVRTVAKNNPRLAIDLLKCVDIGISNRLADDVFILFQRDEMIPFRLLTKEDVQHFLSKLMQIAELDGYWIETFLSKLSKHYPQLVAAFFMSRVEHAMKTDDWRYRPCNHGPYVHVPLRFRESPEFAGVLKQVSEWMRLQPEDDSIFQHLVGELFEAMFRPFDADLLNILQGWVDTSTPSDMRIISQILSEVQPNFVFEHRPFVIRFLERAKQHGKKTLEIAVDALFRSAITGIRAGSPGAPFPQDLMMKEHSEKALSEISRFSPAYKLYEQIKTHVEYNIQISLREREAFED